MKHENTDSALTYTIGACTYCIARLVENKDYLDQLAQISHDITMIVACLIIVGRGLYDGARAIRGTYRWFKRRNP